MRWRIICFTASNVLSCVVYNQPECVVLGSAAWWTTAVTSSPLAFFEGGSSVAVALCWGDWTEDFVFLDGFGDAVSSSAELADCPPPPLGVGEPLRSSFLQADRVLWGDLCWTCDASRVETSAGDVAWDWGESVGGIWSGVGAAACVSSVSMLSAGRGWQSSAEHKAGDWGWWDAAGSGPSVFSKRFSADCSPSTVSGWTFSASGISSWGETGFFLSLF